MEFARFDGETLLVKQAGVVIARLTVVDIRPDMVRIAADPTAGVTVERAEVQPEADRETARAGRRDQLTTGEVAKLFRVAPRTVAKWFDAGRLKGYRIPGSQDRRVPWSNVLTFARENALPLDEMLRDLNRARAAERESLTTDGAPTA
jgi:excisionase family DNA binding protein